MVLFIAGHLLKGDAQKPLSEKTSASLPEKRAGRCQGIHSYLFFLLFFSCSYIMSLFFPFLLLLCLFLLLLQCHLLFVFPILFKKS